MEKELAGHLVHTFQICSGLLTHTIWLMERHGTEAEFLKHRLAVAEVLAELGIKLLYPIYDEYPDLDPLPPTRNGGQEGPSCAQSPQGEDPPD